MTSFVMFIHAIVCIGLVTIILMQAGRGGGLTEAFSSAESIFGAQTNTFLVKATGVFATLFLVTCLSLAVLSAQKNRSLLDGVIPEPAQTIDLTPETASEEAAASDELNSFVDESLPEDVAQPAEKSAK